MPYSDFFRTADGKRRLEQEFDNWVRTSGNSEYAGLTARYKKLYEARRGYVLALAYASEAGLGGAEIIGLLSLFDKFFKVYEETEDKEALKVGLLERTKAFYKDYDVATDLRILKEMLRLYNSSGMEKHWIPEEVRALAGDMSDLDKWFKKSIFTDQARLEAFVGDLTSKSIAKARKEPLYRMMQGIQTLVKEQISPRLNEIQRELSMLDRAWIAGLMEMRPDKVFYPDANSTLRVAYGKIAGYAPRDGV